MRVAVTDACIFIDLLDVDLVDQFFEFDLEVHTTLEVYNELFDSQQRQLMKFVKKGRLSIFKASGVERIKMSEIKLPSGLSDADRSALYLANKMDAVLLSSDKKVRKSAKRKKIECHGFLWIIDQLVEDQRISSQVAIEKLKQLQKVNFMFRTSVTLGLEIEKRITKWS